MPSFLSPSLVHNSVSVSARYRIDSGSGMSFAPLALPPNGVPSGRFNVTTEVIVGRFISLSVMAIFAV